MLEKLECAGN